MIIGIDASRSLIKERTGTENYAYHLIKNLLEIDKKNEYRLYNKKNIPWPYLWTQGGLALECLLRPPDILFIPSHTLPVIRRSSLKTIVTIHGLEYEYLPEHYKFPQKLYLNKSTEYAVKRATRLIAVSQWTKNQLVDRLGADPKKISVVHEGVKKIENCKACGFLRNVRIENSPYVLFVGTIQPRKNLVRLIEAFSSLQTQGQALNLKIAGKRGWMDKEILAAPKRFRVGERVKFLGYVNDQKLARLYQNALFFILPSLCEGFGLPVLEAMTYGCPVIVAKAGALPEIVGQAGLLVNPKSVSEIASAMKLMIDNRELREALREKGYQRVKQFSWQKTARKTVKIFQEVYEN